MEENMEEGQTQKGTVLKGFICNQLIIIIIFFLVSLFALDTCQ